MSKYVTDEQMELEIEQLQQSPAVKLARREVRLKYKRRQALYALRALEKRGRELMEMGVTVENIDSRIVELMAELDTEATEEKGE